MTYGEECEAVRREMESSRAAIRAIEFAKPLQLSIDEILGARQRSIAERQEAARRALGCPSGTSFSDGSMGRPGPRNARFVR